MFYVFNHEIKLYFCTELENNVSNILLVKELLYKRGFPVQLAALI